MKDGALERLDAHQAGFTGLFFMQILRSEALADSADWAELVEPVSNSEIFASRTCQLHMLHSFIPQSQNYVINWCQGSRSGWRHFARRSCQVQSLRFVASYLFLARVLRTSEQQTDPILHRLHSQLFNLEKQSINL